MSTEIIIHKRSARECVLHSYSMLSSWRHFPIRHHSLLTAKGSREYTMVSARPAFRSAWFTAAKRVGTITNYASRIAACTRSQNLSMKPLKSLDGAAIFFHQDRSRRRIDAIFFFNAHGSRPYGVRNTNDRLQQRMRTVRVEDYADKMQLIQCSLIS